MTASPTSADTGPTEQTAGWGDLRERVVRWHDPRPTAAVGLGLTGLDYITAMAEGQLPNSPIGALVGLELVSAAPGDVVFACVADESFANPVGIVHGGLACTLLDSATASAVHATLGPGFAFTTIDLSVSYLRAVQVGEALQAHGWVTKPGRRVCFAEADVRNAAGMVVARASSSLLVYEL